MNATWIKRLDLAGMAILIASLVLVVIWAFPIFWALLSTATPAETAGGFFRTYANVLFTTDLGRWYLNSIVTSGGVTIIVIAISSACGYAISQIEFTGRRLLWLLILGSFMIPVQALIVNHFFLVYQWGLLNTWLGVILPQLIAPIAAIVYKQFFDAIPREFGEAAFIDGAKHWQIFLKIYLPMNWGVTLALAIIVFIGAWNAFLWPFLAVTKPELMNVTVSIAEIRSYGVSGLAAAMMAGLPVAVIYLLFQRRITDAITMSVGITSDK
ncbi:carbohydrate ABC transporter permease [Ponticoccus sp. SC2-23]|uniref:carbohydrate ABC transporter permease n=1 Tax=Alexandriicola marinus TaxID=2081710 RepID=UPI000FDB9D51|nr:carbohydrate ABC transporter permease [Alexandriicola marinus]MBM1221366.1 carbohydrate ABC transporter permease [Ponticoccus sp. SC6-9]MBM1226407.1 carbohydrate ABC transporter permease [Ponticoccus sp. SC6-15]MBM1230358.1 carbohydrate ABC transporter permease [Ponticoccus sp. SC6-38]MBM1234881.1 carbohydrate ABC transporter permease [Ponticoccus sp. SC6-45]MBM1239379.1 carbohydrate ABC transporter permease [Ponticoccus sp. SC6-49]MBM1243161.1 carbohydrate ABC transporter permease [Pontic